MRDSERLERYKDNIIRDEFCDNWDEIFAERICALLNHADINKFCMVDAKYYDFSEIPHDIYTKLNIYRDMYLIYGITDKCEIISKWVERYDLDSDDPIVDGEVVRSEKKNNNAFVPEINESFNPKLLSTPMPPNFFDSFKGKI